MASIANLAIQISTDTSRMSAGLANAQAQLTRFQANVSASTASSGEFNAGLLRTGLAATAAFIGVQKLGKFLGEARKAAAELQDRLDAVNGTKDNVENLNTQYKRLWETIGVVGLPIVRRMAGAVDNLIGAFNAANAREGFGNTDKFLADLRARESAMAKAKEDAERQAKETQRAEEQAAEARARMLAKLQDRAADLTANLRTPLEKFTDEQKELTKLFESGYINAQTFQRGLRGIADDFDKARNAATEFKHASRIGTAEQGSQQAASILAAARNASQNKEAEARMLAAVERQTRLQTQLVNKQPVKIVSGGF